MAELAEVVQATQIATQNFALDVWRRFDTVAQVPIVAVASLALVVIGYLMLTGQLPLTAGQLFPRLFRWVALLAILLKMENIFAWSYALVTTVPDAVAVFLLGGGTVATEADVIGLIEAVIQAGLDAASKIWTTSSFTDINAHILCCLLLLTGLILAVLAAVLLMVSKLGVGILLAVAPFFLLLRLLDIGKGLFEGWLRQLLTFALIPIFVYSLIALNFQILTTGAQQLTAASTAGDLTLTAAVPYLLIAIVNMILLTQVMGWAGGVGGGIALAVSAGGVMAGVSTAARLGMAGARATQKAGAAAAPLVAAGAAAAARNVVRNLGRGG